MSEQPETKKFKKETFRCWHCSQVIFKNNNLEISCPHHPGIKKPFVHSLKGDVIYQYSCCKRISTDRTCSKMVHSVDKSDYEQSKDKKFLIISKSDLGETKIPPTAYQFEEEELDQEFIVVFEYTNEVYAEFYPRSMIDLDKKTEKRINMIELKASLKKTNHTECFAYDDEAEKFEDQMSREVFLFIPLLDYVILKRK